MGEQAVNRQLLRTFYLESQLVCDPIPGRINQALARNYRESKARYFGPRHLPHRWHPDRLSFGS